MPEGRLDPVPPARLRFVSQAALRYGDVDSQGRAAVPLSDAQRAALTPWVLGI